VPELNIRSEQEPIGSRLAERHSHAAGIDDTSLPNRAIELHVGVTADDEWDTESFEHRQQPIFGRQPSEPLVFVARRRMTEQHLAQPDNLGSTRHRPSGQQLLERRVDLLRLPSE
jgi:hypothetical protein